jgi:large subunit ribosomal protein L22
MPDNLTILRKATKLERKRRFKNLKAVGRFLRCPPDKARIRARTIVGFPATLAIKNLELSPTKSARLILGVLNSAVANAVNNEKLELATLDVDKVMVDKGPMLKRHHPISHGSAQAILKRFCHITVLLKETVRGRKKK